MFYPHSRHKYIIVLIFVICAIIAWGQTRLNPPKLISGEITGKPIITDTIYFVAKGINNRYFEKIDAFSILTENKYTIANNISYPQMYSIFFSSDRNKRPWRNGDYFIDSSTTTIKTNYLSEECNEVNGITANEYQTKFIPFMTRGMIYDCKSADLTMLFYSNNRRADTLLLNYIIQNPNSYVALWKLIERFSFQGETAVRQQALASFSNKIKSEKLWKILNQDFKNTKIKENEKFPNINLKDYSLKPTKLVFPKAKYTLIDYWFARCRPCLDTIPELKKLYATYKAKGFEIISISVDETINVPIWQKRVKEHGLVWTQYLEENNFRNNELGIKVFPTFILLDGKGTVIWKDFDLHDLDTFLKKHT
jgi:thiol-disulfide isomerase/thioredoxin